MKVLPRDYKQVLKNMKVEKIALDAEATEEAQLMGKDAFEELQKLASSSLINKVDKVFFIGRFSYG